jgi:hypothetical protein
VAQAIRAGIHWITLLAFGPVTEPSSPVEGGKPISTRHKRQLPAREVMWNNSAGCERLPCGRLQSCSSSADLCSMPSMNTLMRLSAVLCHDAEGNG